MPEEEDHEIAHTGEADDLIAAVDALHDSSDDPAASDRLDTPRHATAPDLMGISTASLAASLDVHVVVARDDTGCDVLHHIVDHELSWLPGLVVETSGIF